MNEGESRSVVGSESRIRKTEDKHLQIVCVLPTYVQIGQKCGRATTDS